MRREEQQLLPKVDYGSSSKLHMKTYTAGEDNNRLAEMAKEFGLQQHRQPRRQVRERVSAPLSSLTEFFHERFLHHEFADVRLRSVFTSHDHLEEDEEGRELMGRPPKWQEDASLEEIEDPHLPSGGDLTSAVLGIIKGMVGPAILYLPHGFAKAGWIFAIPCMILSTLLFLGSSACLLDAWKIENARSGSAGLLSSTKSKRTILSYPELAYRALGSTGELVVKLGIAFMQSGVCLTYLIFVPQNLSTVTSILFGYDIDASYFIIVMLIAEIPLSWIRDIRRLTITNLLANVLILYGLITCMGFALSNAIQSEAGRGPILEILYRFANLKVFNSEGWFLFIGTSVSLAMILLKILLNTEVLVLKSHLSFSYVIRFCCLRERLPYWFPCKKLFIAKRIAKDSQVCIRMSFSVSSVSTAYLECVAGCRLEMM